jgi:hypothetical protein
MRRRPRPYEETKLGEFMEWWSDAPEWFKGVLLIVVILGAILVWQLAGGDPEPCRRTLADPHPQCLVGPT